MKKKLRLALIPLCFYQIVFGQTMDWVSLPQTTNSSVTCLTSYHDQLIACGAFDTAGTLPVNKIAAWDGSAWSALGKGIRGKNTLLYKTYTFNNALYAVGNFDSAGTVACRDIAKWDGTGWSALGSGSDSMVYCMALYNNELYAAGSFSTMDGVPAANIAKWDGTSWLAVGGGVKGKYIRDLCVFQNELYATGTIDTINGNVPCRFVVKWDGNSWDTILPPYTSFYNITVNGERLTMQEWKNKLLFGSFTVNGFITTNEIMQWDGGSWTLFSLSPLPDIRTSLIYNNALFFGGGIIPVVTHIENSGSWVHVGSELYGSVWSLCEYKGELYCAGNFNVSSESSHNYIAKLANVTGITTQAKEQLMVTVFPNPVKDKLHVEFENSLPIDLKLSIRNSFGQLVYSKDKIDLKQELDLSFLKPGVYYLKAENTSGQNVFKVVKE